MKNTRLHRLPMLTAVGRCLQWFARPSQKTTAPRRARNGYTLIEVLAAASIISIGTTALVSLSSTLMLQEELASRVAITRNYQENTVRLWQLGLSTVQITALMPSMAQNPLLQQAMFNNPVIVENGLTTVNGIVMETSLCTAIVNISQNPSAKAAGASFTLTAYRPRLVTDLRTPPP